MALMALSMSAMAQMKAVRVESPIVSEKDFVWYTEQKEAWEAETQKNPANETAWLNYPPRCPSCGFKKYAGTLRNALFTPLRGRTHHPTDSANN